MAELRYAFGRNWDEFIARRLSPETIADSARHLANLLKTDTLEGSLFLDIGCGSGVHSVAALRLGAARVVSFDYDPDSVAVTRKVREWAGAHANWEVLQGSVLDERFMDALPKADVVYSWGVLHHTGDMWTSVRNAARALKPEGEFYIALYSSDNYVSPSTDYWVTLKRAYNQASPMVRTLMEMQYLHWRLIEPALSSGADPLAAIADYGNRGMTAWTDVKDWLGGYPIEFASFVETRDFCARELSLDLVNVLAGEGCTEYVFARPSLNAKWRAVEAARRAALVPLPGPYENDGGMGWRAAMPSELAAFGDTDADFWRSPVMLYENDAPLGLAHAPPSTVRDYGGGRFRHEGPTVIFSATDSGNPNTNGRRYAYCQAY